ncbi:cell morphogenesis N-terminal-domain-containing protein [Microdochium bolleyi]|uniref:Cell morphogenesis N-terminal-domain-containing protein n=1 Tax=Microdochium bolleyi TaxID=196109 RepID=A0A136J4S3_9PEZI|nr:cell morphogenesis N-terminal-domain-containing protein [Microdochium bolleyi]
MGPASRQWDADGWDHTLRHRSPDSAVSRSVIHSRESSIDKVSASGLAGIPESLRTATSATSPGIRGGIPRGGLGGILERVVDPKSATYGHHRQTSIVHGIQHSRNGSASSTSSPLSPQMIAAAGAGFLPERPDARVLNRLDSEVSLASMTSRAPSALSGSTAINGAAHGSEPIHKSDHTSNRARRDHRPQQSASAKQLQTKEDALGTVGGYAMHVLFTSFIVSAEDKLSECNTVPFDPEPSIETICGPGADPNFDQFIVALAQLAKQRPKPLIDSIMLWRKRKSEKATEARAELQAVKATQNPANALVRRNTEPLQMAVGGSSTSEPIKSPTPEDLASKQLYAAQAERRSHVAIYILCRVLLEVISQTTLECVTLEMEGKLEDIIFGQLTLADSEQLHMSPLKMANWNIFAQLLGAMSDINFVSVTRKYLSSLERLQQEASLRHADEHMELTLGGMKHIRIKIDKDGDWEKSCNFLVALGRLFTNSHGRRVKSAFCHALENFLLPVAATATVGRLTSPKWGEVISNISPRLAQMFVKPHHWHTAFPLTATMLCVSPPESFSSQWLQLVRSLQPKLKDRSTRAMALQVVSRLLWNYLYRCNEPMTAVSRKLEEVIQLILPTSRRTFAPVDIAPASPVIQIIRFIGYKYPEYCCKSIIFPLINAELFISNKELKVDQLDPDRVVIGIRAFLAMLSDLEKREHGRPPFPQHYPVFASERLGPASPMPSSVRGASRSPLPSTEQDEALSRPVMTSNLADGALECYKKFSEILGKITIICDNAFGGQAALDEKFSTSSGPKTPMSDTFNFSRRDDQNPADQKQSFYDLLHVAVQALPRCLSADIPFTPLINLLCTGTAHVQRNIAESSAQSLKSIARQSYAQPVTTGFARFIFNFDDRYSTMSDGGMLGPSHIENTLRLYVELLQIWRDEIRQRTKEAALNSTDPNGTDKRGMQLDLSNIWAEVEYVEARGLFFLCSQSRRVRHFAITVLRLITEFDKALGKSGTEEAGDDRLINILENKSKEVMSVKDDHLSIAERSRLQKGMQNGNNQGALIELCTSDVSYDTTLWFKLFPNFIRIAYDRYPFTVTISRDLVCERVLQMFQPIMELSKPRRGLYSTTEPGSGRFPAKSPITQSDIVVEQWKLYLTFACTTLGDTGASKDRPSQDSQHSRKASRPADKIVSARTLFKFLTPLLMAPSTAVRDAVVLAMGSININTYRALLEDLQAQGIRCNDDAKARLHQRANSGPRQTDQRFDLLRTELTHIYKLTAHFLKDPIAHNDDWIMNYLCTYTKDLKIFLMDGDVQMNWEYQTLRRHYCGLMEELFEGINRTTDPSRWMTFESRKSSFALMEDWCGFSPNQQQIRQREDTMRQSVIDQQTLGERQTVSASMEIEKRNLKTAALNAMAALCAGPISVTTESGAVLQFDLRRMLAWIECIFSSGSDRATVSGKRALKNMIVHNKEYPYLLEHCISRCYLAEALKVQENYFAVVTDVLLELPDYPSPAWKLLGLCLFTLGNDQSEVRSKSARVLRAVEERQQGGRGTKLRDFDISISDKTKAVYKLAQFEISMRLAKQNPSLAFHIFSEFSFYFKNLQQGAQRNAIAAILPWIQTIELQVDPNGGPTAQSYVLLANLLELTIKSSAALHNEVQALWQALATGPSQGNVRLILDFIITLCLERREQNFVEYAKQIVVFLASTSSASGSKVIEFLLVQISPKAMVPNEKRETTPPPPDINQLPYCADLADTLPIGPKQAGLSLGQLSLILLVDLMVAPIQLTAENLPLLLQVITVLWDHYTPLVQEQAREMLVHLVHELAISKLDDDNITSPETKESIESLIESIRQHEQSVVWGYDDNNGKVDDREHKVPPGMEKLTSEVVKTFEISFPGVKEKWSRLSLTWATSCPVRHLACRSFQIFRCILTTSMDQLMLGDMLARLSNTIADEDTEIQTFSMEILTTLKTLIIKLEPETLLSFPQLFWTTCACLDSINEAEFLEAVDMLNIYLEKLDFHSPRVRTMLFEGRPPRWGEGFEGVQPLLYKGLRSSTCLTATLKAIDSLVQLPSDSLIGNDNRLFFALIANFPLFMQALEDGALPDEVLKTVEILSAVAEAQGLEPLYGVLEDLTHGRHVDSAEFVGELFSALREFFLPKLDLDMIIMLMGFLTNSNAAVKIQTMRLLCDILPQLNVQRPEISSLGSDLISPLLRLLQTEFCMEALEVLNCMMTMTSTPMDQHHLRMSMTHPSSKAIRKEYERTESLFARKTETTRGNIHAAFYVCQAEVDEGLATEPTPTPEVEFHTDEYNFGYFDMSGRTETMMSDDLRGEDHMPDLVTKLDSLDDFFDDMSSQTSPSDGRSSRTITEFTGDGFENGPQLYDEQILPILHQASSSTADTANTMTPGAFSAGLAMRNNAAAASGGAGGSSRPGMHSRSVTSPSAPASYQNQIGGGDLASDDGYNTEDVFSDGDEDMRLGGGGPSSGGLPSASSTGGFASGPSTGNTADGSFSFETMIKNTKQSTRSHMRRLTGGKSREAERQRDLFRTTTAVASPQVPKVPDSYLQLSAAKPSTPSTPGAGI